MAGGGTGNLIPQGSGQPYVPPVTPTTSTSSVSTTRTPTFDFINYGENPFGPGKINWDGQQYNWAGNLAGATPIVLLGDNVTGKYLPSKMMTPAMQAGSPLDIDEATKKVVMEANAKPGGIEALKALLQKKQAYGSLELGAISIAQGAAFDPHFYSAVMNALISATGVNAQIAASGGKNAKLLSFNKFLETTSAIINYGNTTGSGGNQKRVVYQKFKPEEFEIVIDQLFQQTVGRGASKEELVEFTSKLQGYADKNPAITTSKTSGNTTSVTESAGVTGDTVESMMRDQALASPEAESYNKATKYLTYFMDALDSPIQLGK